MPFGQAAAAAKATRGLFNLCMRVNPNDEDASMLKDGLGDLVEVVTAVKIGIFTADPLGAGAIIVEKAAKYLDVMQAASEE